MRRQPIFFQHAARASLLGASILALCSLTACATAPGAAGPARTTVEVPQRWETPISPAAEPQPLAWWQDFGSTELDGLIAMALEANRDLQITAARLAQARALLAVDQSQLKPRLDGDAAAGRGRANSADPRTERSSAGLRASWELDLFGRLGFAVDAAQSDAQGAAAAVAASRIALAADVATAYFELRTLSHRVALARSATALAQKQSEVAKFKLDAGTTTALDLARWQAEVAQERATAEQLDGQRRLRQQQLALLLGTTEAPVLALQRAAAPPPAPAPLLPGALLERRPDVRRQVLALDAALARVGVARAELYPQLHLSWSGAGERLALLGGSAAPQSVIGYGVSLSFPVLDGGRIRANIAVREALAQEAMLGYEKAMLAAVVDVEAALVQWTACEASWRAWEAAHEASAQAAQTAERIFNAGVIDQTAVLDAHRSKVRANDALLQAEGSRWIAAVSLRRAFAGDL
jgi:multidrug efflux system outer membrane protein